MTAASSYFDRNPSTSIRPGLSHLQPGPSSPHTPNRAISSTFSSPSVSYRAEEDPLVFELGTRHIHAGFVGESSPRCRLSFGPEQSRRVGDYRAWLPGHAERSRKWSTTETWGDESELWDLDLRKCDLRLVEDKFELAVRKAYTKYLLLDAKLKRSLLVLPSVMPHQLLSTILGTLFNNFQMPSITLLSPPILSTLAGGCRSGLIVDIGWRETLVTGVYEYCEISQSRTTRAMRQVTLEMAKILETFDRQSFPNLSAASSTGKDDEPIPMIRVGLDQAEEVTLRMAWCRSREDDLQETLQKNEIQSNQTLSPILEETSSTGSNFNAAHKQTIAIPSPSSTRRNIEIPFSDFAESAEKTFFAKGSQKCELDDHEQPLHHLIYKSLLQLPPDARSVCMSRIMFTGGGSNIPGLKARLLDELSALVNERGWDPVEGKAPDKRRRQLKEINDNRQKLSDSSGKISEPIFYVPASQVSQTSDTILEKIERDQKKGEKPIVQGVIRGVETLGPWAGASLLAGLRIKGIVVIERDAFLQHGLLGARKDLDSNVGPRKSMVGSGAILAGAGKGISGLGIWA